MSSTPAENEGSDESLSSSPARLVDFAAARANGHTEPDFGRHSYTAEPDSAEGSTEALATSRATRDDSWGRYPAHTPASRRNLAWSDDFELPEGGGSFLAHGQGRSYGDSCLNDGGTLLETGMLDRLLAFDAETGVLRCESGTTLAEILEFAVPRGWFLPTTPGTKFVSVGGAIANDVHGKNHHVVGSFGCHVLRFELVRSDGRRYLCSPSDNADLFGATIGGLGLTGLISWAEIRLRRISGPIIDMESIRFRSLHEYFEVSAHSEQRFEYTMAWIDCLSRGKQMGRGLFMRGNHGWQHHIPARPLKRGRMLPVPLEFPSIVLTAPFMRLFNEVHYRAQLLPVVKKQTHYDPFFYPLDSFANWNRAYGRGGLLQHQCVVPRAVAEEALGKILEDTSAAGQGSFLGVIKTFGNVQSPGLMSFPRPGVTLALDFPMKGPETLGLLDRLDEIVMDYGGAVYPAKDARMSGETFRHSFPRWSEFAEHIDERFSSSFWRRVMGTRGTAQS